MFLKTIEEADATGRIAEIYEEERRSMGLVMSATQCWTVRPDLLPLWHDFFDGLKAGFTLPQRDWLLITFIAAHEVPSTYCTFVYAQRLAKALGSREAMLAVHDDFHTAGLSPRDVAMLDYARKVAREAHTVTQTDIDGLRKHGFSDPQIGDIALAASLRAFISRFFEATGAGPEAPFIDSDPAVRDALTVGRPLEQG
jgi:uncharacterized peroxidase-related enzyme